MNYNKNINLEGKKRVTEGEKYENHQNDKSLPIR